VPILTYSLLRLGLFAVAVAVLWLVGVRHWLALVGFGTIIAAALSFLLLKRQGDAAAGYLAERSARRKAAGEDEAVEDRAVDDETT